MSKHYPVMSKKDKEALDLLWSKFGLTWFNCRGCGVSREQLQLMVQRGFLESNQSRGRSTVNYRVSPLLRCD